MCLLCILLFHSCCWSPRSLHNLTNCVLYAWSWMLDAWCLMLDARCLMLVAFLWWQLPCQLQQLLYKSSLCIFACMQVVGTTSRWLQSVHTCHALQDCIQLLCVVVQFYCAILLCWPFNRAVFCPPLLLLIVEAANLLLLWWPLTGRKPYLSDLAISNLTAD